MKKKEKKLHPGQICLTGLLSTRRRKILWDVICSPFNANLSVFEFTQNLLIYIHSFNIVENYVSQPGTVNEVLSLWICFCTVIKSKSCEVTCIQASVGKGYGESASLAVCLLLSHLPLGSDLSYHFSTQNWPVTDRISSSGFKWMCCSLNGWASSTQQKDWGVWTMWCGI